MLVPVNKPIFIVSDLGAGLQEYLMIMTSGRFGLRSTSFFLHETQLGGQCLT